MVKKSTVLFCALALSLSTVAFAQTDSALTASVKSKLAAADIKGSAVTVSTADHVVTLTGVVGTEAAKDKALSIARDTTGVTSVVDKLTVGKTTADKAADGVAKGADKSADAVDKAAHATAKGVDKSAKETGKAADKTADKTAKAADKSKDGIEKAADKTGEAVSTAAKATGEAVETAAKKTGEAVGVGADKTKEATEKAADKTAHGTEKAADKTAHGTEKAADKTAEGTAKAGAAVSDASVTASVKTKLLGDGSTPGLKLDVDTSDGVVTLTGNVATAAEHTNALRLARGTKGVKSVVDKITVAAK